MLSFKKKKSLEGLQNKEISQGKVTFLASASSIIVGLLFGLLFLFLIEVIKSQPDFTNPFYGFSNLITAGFSSIGNVFKILYKSAPLLMCGLAVGFAFKAGLFNIGATGQYTVAAFFALIAAILWQFPWWAALLVAMVAGALWGLIPGIFKAFFNINEVITTIMLNWTALFFVNLLFYNNPGIYTSPERTSPLSTANPSAILPDLGLGEILNSSYINIGIFIAIIFAVLIYILLNKTTFGFEIKACGHNKNASIYAGIKAKKTIIFTMLISGALAGLGGGIQFLSGTVQYTVSNTTLLSMGFNGIPVALLAFSNPLAIIASSLFISFLQVGGESMQPVYSAEMVNVILAVIIYFSAFSLIMSQFIKKKLNKKNGDGDLLKDNIEEVKELEETPPDRVEEQEEVKKTPPKPKPKPKSAVKKTQAKPTPKSKGATK
ncbi:ABC transporter permease [Mycoplasmatota bacterium WC30]